MVLKTSLFLKITPHLHPKHLDFIVISSHDTCNDIIYSLTRLDIRGYASCFKAFNLTIVWLQLFTSSDTD